MQNKPVNMGHVNKLEWVVYACNNMPASEACIEVVIQYAWLMAVSWNGLQPSYLRRWRPKYHISLYPVTLWKLEINLLIVHNQDRYINTKFTQTIVTFCVKKDGTWTLPSDSNSFIRSQTRLLSLVNKNQILSIL